MKAIEDEAKLRQPKHTHWMILRNTKRGSDRHSDFLEILVENDSVVEFKQMTGQALMIHLFIRDADPQMSKIATEILRTEKPTVHELRTKVKETEAAVWYNRKEYRKMGTEKKDSTKFCKPCNSKSHDEARVHKTLGSRDPGF